MKSMIRIIGGTYRGKKIAFTESEGLRPTPDRVRETVFNWLMNVIRGARCLDAFAGSGALGLEAFSRGAASVVFIEPHKLTYSHLKKVILEFNAPHLSLLQTDACDFIRQSPTTFDLIFLDPPYDLNLVLPCLEDIGRSNLLSPGGLVYIESATPLTLPPHQWTVLHQKKAGLVYYGLLKKIEVDVESY